MRNILLFAALCVILVFSVGVRGQDPAGAANGGATYIGEKSCKKCHIKQHRTWGKMKHANAWEALPEKYRNMDAKDDEGRNCVSCHVTGWGHGDQGGFVDPEKSADLLGVQCEACHGPGSKHKEAGQKVLDEKRKSFNEGEENFITRRTTNCANCHNPHINHTQYKEG